MFVSRFNIEVSFQSTVEEHYFDIKERDFVVREGIGKLDGRCTLFKYVMKSFNFSSPYVQRRNISSM